MMISNRFFTMALLGASLVAALSAGADSFDTDCAVPVNPVGQLVTLEGSATAVGANGCSRALACGSSLFGGESISTGGGGGASYLVGDVLTQLGPNTQATIGTTAAGAPNVALRAGGVRVVDTRASGPPARITAFGSSVDFIGNDVGAQVAGGGANFCAGAPISLTRGGNTTTVDPGACASEAAASGSGGGAGAGGGGGGGGGLSLSGDTCMQVASNSHIEPLPPVSGPPDGPPIPDPPETPPRTPCEVGACGRSFDPPTVTEQPPTQSDFPGGGGTFGGGQDS